MTIQKLAFPPEEVPKLEMNWATGARLYEEYGRLIRQKGQRLSVGILVEIESDAPEAPQYFWERCRIGTAPRQLTRYTNRDKSQRRVWRWHVGKQLEVYWFLSNLSRFLRGPHRRKVEEALHLLADRLALQSQLARLKPNETRAERIRLSTKERDPKFLSRFPGS